MALPVLPHIHYFGLFGAQNRAQRLQDAIEATLCLITSEHLPSLVLFAKENATLTPDLSPSPGPTSRFPGLFRRSQTLYRAQTELGIDGGKNGDLTSWLLDPGDVVGTQHSYVFKRPQPYQLPFCSQLPVYRPRILLNAYVRDGSPGRPFSFNRYCLATVLIPGLFGVVFPPFCAYAPLPKVLCREHLPRLSAQDPPSPGISTTA